MKLEYVLFAVIAGFSKAMMDTIMFHKKSWFFDWLKQKNWRLYKWFLSEWSPQDSWWKWLFGDGWHSFQNVALISIAFYIWCVSDLNLALGFLVMFEVAFNSLWEFLK